MAYLITDLTNCTCNIPNWSLLKFDIPTDIVITADEGYYFTTSPYLTDKEYGVLDLTTTDNKVYTGTVTATTSTNLTIVATAVKTSAEVTKYTIDTEITNATTNLLPETEYVNGDIVHIEVVANDDYYFATAPTVSYSIKGVPQTKVFISDETGEYKTTFYYDLEISNNMSTVNGITVKADGQVIPQVDKYGIITMYNPTPTELKQIGETRYMNDVDLGNYISNLIKVYVKIPQGNKATVLLGGYKTGVESNVIVTDIIETDCGSVEIVGNYNNAKDYENTTVEMYLPFVGFVQLDTVKVMNETLKLIYKTNVINGDTIACLYNTTGTLLYTYNTTASFEIPYKLNADNEPQGQLNVNSNYLFGFTPFITVRYNKALNSTNVVANDDRLTTLENESGFVRCSEVFNTINATTNEKEEIETLLKGGVIL